MHPHLFPTDHPGFPVGYRWHRALCVMHPASLDLTAKTDLLDCDCPNIGRTQPKEGI